MLCSKADQKIRQAPKLIDAATLWLATGLKLNTSY